MPARDADGEFILMICPKTKGEPASDHIMHAESHGGGHDMDGMPDHRSPSDHETVADAPCDYAVGGHAAMPDMPEFVPERERLALDSVIVPHPITGIFPRGLPPATGPPGA